MSIKEWGFVSFNSLVDEFLHLCQDIIAYESLAKKANYLQIIMEMALTDTVPWPFLLWDISSCRASMINYYFTG